MAGQLQYPATRHRPVPLADLSLKTERARLSGPALRAFLNIMTRWSIPDREARQLLGGIAASNSRRRLQAQSPTRVLDQEGKLVRISYLIGIFKALRILHDEALADGWVRMPNRNRIFGGRRPLDYMIQGGAPAMELVRRLLDARRGGA